MLDTQDRNSLDVLSKRPLALCKVSGLSWAEQIYSCKTIKDLHSVRFWLNLWDFEDNIRAKSVLEYFCSPWECQLQDSCWSCTRRSPTPRRCCSCPPPDDPSFSSFQPVRSPNPLQSVTRVRTEMVEKWGADEVDLIRGHVTVSCPSSGHFRPQHQLILTQAILNLKPSLIFSAIHCCSSKLSGSNCGLNAGSFM